MKSLKTLLQEVTAGIKAWANANFSLGTHVHGNVTNDGKVGTTANLPLITGTGGAVQAGAFGNQANTFCEGNDSRLSDARTPVAHTHGKADITDLFNSANTWSSLNTYSNGQIQIKSLSQEVGVTPANNAIQYLEFTDKNNEQHGVIGLWDYTTGATEVQMYVADKYKNGAKDSTGTKQSTVLSFGFKADGTKFLLFDGYVDNSLYPIANNTYNLGDNSYQWNNVYAKSYYYNGTAWGLDKDNEWTATNTFSNATNSVLYFKSGTSGSYSDIRWIDNNDSHYATLRGRVNELTLGLQYSSASAWYSGASVTINNTGAVQIKAYDGTEPWTVNFTPVGVYPTSNNALELGTSTNKWKSFNGINPGALSLPNVNAVTGSSNTQLQDISGDLVQDQYFNCYFTPRMDGWAYIALDCSSATIRSGFSSYTVSVKTARFFANSIYTQAFTKNENAWSDLDILFPVTANKEITLELTFTGFSVIKAYVIPCLGNV